MKRRTWILFIVLSLLFTVLVGCDGNVSDKATDDSATEWADAVPDVEGKTEELTNQFIGSWVCDESEAEHLTFSDDGTGTYTGDEDKDYKFTYSIDIEKGNGWATYHLLLKYDNDESEDREFFFADDDTVDLGKPDQYVINYSVYRREK